jgi:serine/threonine protein kinase
MKTVTAIAGSHGLGSSSDTPRGTLRAPADAGPSATAAPDADLLRLRARELAGIELPDTPRVLRDTGNFMAIDRGDVLELAGHPYLVLGHEREGRFGIDDQPKYWVKRAVSLRTGRMHVLKLVFRESFSTEVHGRHYACERSAAKEARVLEVVRGHPSFVQGTAVLDDRGNLVRVLEFIEGPTLLQHVGGLGMTYDRYLETALPPLLAETYDCFDGIVWLHGHDLCHGDIRNDHVILDASTGRARWIDFDFTRPSLAFDVWSLGNVLNCVLAKGFVTFHELRRSRPEILARVGKEDASVFFPHRVMNLDRIHPGLPSCLARMLRHFAAGDSTRYERADQVRDDLGACMDSLGWARRGAEARAGR